MQRIRKAGETFEYDISGIEFVSQRKAGEFQTTDPELVTHITKTALEGEDYIRNKGIADFNLAEAYYLDGQLEQLDTIEPSEDPEPHSSSDSE